MSDTYTHSVAPIVRKALEFYANTYHLDSFGNRVSDGKLAQEALAALNATKPAAQGVEE